jgi:hypothetical protein
MIAYIVRNRDRFGVEPICRLLPIARPPITTPSIGRHRLASSVTSG